MSADAADRLLARAAGPGRMRGIGLDLWRSVRANPHQAGSLLRHGLRAARALHSAERRFVAEVLYDLVRRHAWYAQAVGLDDPESLWTAALVARGVPAPTPAFEAAAALDASLRGLEPLPALALRAGVDLTTAAALQRAFGDDVDAFLAACAGRAPVVLRVPLRVRPRFEASAVAVGVSWRPGTRVPDAVVLPPGTPTDRLAGPFEVQDEASQEVVAFCGVAPGQTVLDACAGAGGKSLALAELGARVTAVDVRDRALRALIDRAQDAGLGGRIRVVHAPDGVRPELGRFDIVLVDAPCSGSGTWRRHPELRWRLPVEPSLLALQRALIAQAAACVAPGGTLVYATCSVLLEENDDAVAAFEQTHPSFVREGTLRTSPHRDGTDGFFAARWRAPS
jgi:16S rRNA (cytosine967-C5)-methyltransferase